MNQVRGREAVAVEWLAIAAVILGAAARFLARPHAPLWIDETWTATIVGQQSFVQFWHMVHRDVSPPLYYFVMRPWQAVFGLSDFALRAPSLIFGIVTPLIIAFTRVAGLTRAERLTWAALVALWIPGIGYAQDARAYSLVLLLATVQTLLFARLMQRSTLAAAAFWVISADLTIAAHYAAVWLALAQGLVFLGVKRFQAVKTWPAALLVAPIVALIAWQWPAIAGYARYATTTGVLPLSALPGVIVYFLGAPGLLFGLPAFLLGFWLIGRRRPAPAPEADARDLAWTAAATVVGAAVFVAIGFMSPPITFRYLAPFEPGLMLGVVLLLSVLARDARVTALMGLTIVAMAISVRWLAAGAHHDDTVQEPLNYETASESLMRDGARRVVFVWDNPNVRWMHQEELIQYGGFFFERAHAGIGVTPVRVSPAKDPNLVILAAARADRAAVMWMISYSVPNTAAARFPPRISQIDPRWRCRQFGQPKVAAVACMTDAAARP